MCIVSNKESENFLKILGAKNIKNYGNLKFSNIKNNLNKKLDLDFFNKIKNRKVWCAASTHPTEEILCAMSHLKIKESYNNILTIIIPRHVDRIEAIAEELSKLNLKIALYSKFEKISNNTDILLIDSYGEVQKFYEISNCVFLGKSIIESLAENSGQNPVEPARYGCTIFHGPNVSNFKESYEYLKSLGVANETSSFLELSQSLTKELKKDKIDNDQIIEKIENYGLTILNNVLKEIKIYIDS